METTLYVQVFVVDAVPHDVVFEELQAEQGGGQEALAMTTSVLEPCAGTKASPHCPLTLLMTSNDGATPHAAVLLLPPLSSVASSGEEADEEGVETARAIAARKSSPSLHALGCTPLPRPRWLHCPPRRPPPRMLTSSSSPSLPSSISTTGHDHCLSELLGLGSSSNDGRRCCTQRLAPALLSHLRLSDAAPG